VLVRHGESAGNVAREFAEANGHPFIDIAQRDMDVPLSELGERQARAVGLWLGSLGRRAPSVVLTSPYVRAERTASIALAAAGLGLPVVLDERLREREFGVLDRLTKAGIQQRYPEQVEARSRIGKFYHRPPGGESWCDVALRVRSVLDSVGREHSGQGVLIVAHQVVILMFRYVIEHLRAKQPASVRLCTLLDKPARRIVPIQIDYRGFEIPDKFVVGYGLDYAERYRNLPFIGVLKPEVYRGVP